MGSWGHVASYYAATANRELAFAPLHGHVRADVCVIGGGYTGLSAALHLRERGYEVVLLEAERIGWGASGRNGGQVGTGQRRPQSELEQHLGAGHAKLLWDLGLEAVQLVGELIERHRIDCDVAPGILHLGWKARDEAECRREIEHLARNYGYERMRFVPREEARALCGSEVFKAGLLDEGSLHLHPLNYALGLAAAAHDAGVRMHEGSRVLSYAGKDRVRVRTAQGEVDAAHVVLACNGYLGGLEPRVAGKIMPINNFIIATEPLDEATAGQRVVQNNENHGEGFSEPSDPPCSRSMSVRQRGPTKV
jgi:gamma-glutamylputrescine oxidase